MMRRWRVVLMVMVVLLTLQGCLAYQVRRMDPDELDQYIRLLETVKGQGCICISGASAIYGTASAELMGTVGDTDLATCGELCLSLRR